MAIDTNSPARHIMKPWNQTDNRRFPSTTHTDKCNCFTGFDSEINPIQYSFSIFFIRKTDIIELNFPFNWRKFNCIFFICNIIFLFHQFKNTVHRCK